LVTVTNSFDPTWSGDSRRLRRYVGVALQRRALLREAGLPLVGLEDEGPEPCHVGDRCRRGGGERLRHQREGTVETDREDPVVHDLHRRSRAGERAVSHQAYPARATSSRI
jgi:hypothetical protein